MELSYYIKNGMHQYSATNAWNVNMNNSNVNNNDKSNTNYVRAVAEFGKITGQPVISLDSIYDAYFSCLRRKRSTVNACLFERDYIRNCYSLWYELCTMKYEIGKSICFIQNRPKKREVFAADFRDRIVHHWLIAKLEPLFEEYLPQEIFSNRKYKGTDAAVEHVSRCIKYSPNDWWIYKFDIKGFFMSIDKRILWSKLEWFIDTYYKEDDISVVKWLTYMIVMHCPQYNCIIRSPLSEWDGLDESKSLFTQDMYHGLAIGNLPSQVFANFLLSYIVNFIKGFGIIYIADYVDDFACVGEKRLLMSLREPLRKYMKEELGLTLHPNKQYMQHQSKGLTFIGRIIKVERIYTSGRTIDHFNGLVKRMPRMVEEGKDINSLISRINSYMGILSRYNCFKIRKRIGLKALSALGGKAGLNNHCKCAFILGKYSDKFKIKKYICMVKKHRKNRNRKVKGGKYVSE